MATKETTENLLKILFAKGERITSNELEEIIVKIKKDDKLNEIFNDFKKYNLYVDINENKEIIKKNFFKNFKLLDQRKLNINQEELVCDYTPLEMFLISVLWKQGDLGKEQRIIDGIKSPDTLTNKVFPQFGRFLISLSIENQKNNPNYENIQPIIDQHSLRAFCFSIKKEYKESKTPSQEIYAQYIEWHKSVLRKHKDSEFRFLMLNEIMFVLGKALKTIK